MLGRGCFASRPLVCRPGIANEHDPHEAVFGGQFFRFPNGLSEPRLGPRRGVGHNNKSYAVTPTTVQVGKTLAERTSIEHAPTVHDAFRAERYLERLGD